MSYNNQFSNETILMESPGICVIQSQRRKEPREEILIKQDTTKHKQQTTKRVKPGVVQDTPNKSSHKAIVHIGSDARLGGENSRRYDSYRS